MTVPTSDNREEYLGNDVTTVFPYAFKIFRNEDLQVYIVESDTQTLQTLGTDYSVSGAGHEDGGSVTMTTAPTAAQELVILRIVEVVQETDLRNQGAYYPETVEDEFDRSRMIDQQQQDEIDRTLSRPEALDYWDGQNRIIRNVAEGVEDDDAVNKGQMDARFTNDVITKTGSHWDGKGLQARNFSARTPVQNSDLPTMGAVKAYFTSLESGAVGDTTKVTAEGTADQRALAAWMALLLNPNDVTVDTATGTQALADAIDQRVIHVASVAEMESLDTGLLADQQAILVTDGSLYKWDAALVDFVKQDMSELQVVADSGAGNLSDKLNARILSFQDFDSLAAVSGTDGQYVIAGSSVYKYSVANTAWEPTGPVSVDSFSGTDTQKATKAIAQAEQYNKSLYFPGRPTPYQIDGTVLTVTKPLLIYGDGGSDNDSFGTIIENVNTAGVDLFKLSDTAYIFGLVMRNMTLISGASAGHIFTYGVGVVFSRFENVNLHQQNPAKSLHFFREATAAGAGIYDTKYVGGEWRAAANFTVPPYDVQVGGTLFNLNSFESLRCDGVGSVHYFDIRNTGTGGNYLEHINFKMVNFERTSGGCVRTSSARAWHFDQCAVWDLPTATTNHLFEFRDDGNLEALDCKFSNYLRNAGTLGAGLADIYTPVGQDFVYESVRKTGGAEPVIDVQLKRFSSFNTRVGAFTNRNTTVNYVFIDNITGVISP